MTPYRKILYSIAVVTILYLAAPFYNINEELERYLETYRFIAQTTCKNQFLFLPWRFTLQFGKVDKLVAGTFTEPNKLYTKVRIIIDEDHFNKLNEDEKVSLMFHELTHYFYNEEHSTDPNSFMHKDQQFTGSKYEVYKQLKELVDKQCLK